MSWPEGTAAHGVLTERNLEECQGFQKAIRVDKRRNNGANGCHGCIGVSRKVCNAAYGGGSIGPFCLHFSPYSPQCADSSRECEMNSPRKHLQSTIRGERWR